VHKDKESDDITIVILFSPAVAHGNSRPTSFGENLHHDVLRVNEGFEIGKLIENIVACVLTDFIFGLVKDLHSEDAENKEDEGKEMEVLDNDMHNLHECHKYTLDVVENGLPQNFCMLGLQKHSETAEKSEESEHFGKIECFGCGIDKHADRTHDVHGCVDYIPSVRK
jgi:hypothetical protein